MDTYVPVDLAGYVLVWIRPGGRLQLQAGFASESDARGHLGYLKKARAVAEVLFLGSANEARAAFIAQGGFVHDV